MVVGAARRGRNTVQDSDTDEVVLGVDFGATNLKALLVDGGGHVHQEFIRPSLSEHGLGEALPRIIRLMEDAQRSADAIGRRIKAVGIGVCAPFDHEKGEIVESAVSPEWRNVPVRDVIKEATGLPVRLENDAPLAILGEWWLGAGEKPQWSQESLWAQGLAAV